MCTAMVKERAYHERKNFRHPDLLTLTACRLKVIKTFWKFFFKCSWKIVITR